MKKLFFLLSSVIFQLSILSPAKGQNVGIGTTTPHASAKLDIHHPNKGLLLPRVALIGTNDAATIPSPATSLLVYNTATSGSGGTAVTPGFYFWNGSAWVMLNTGSGSPTWLLSGNAGTDTSVNFLGTSDNKSLKFKVNNVQAGYVGVPANDGNVFWGYQGGLNNTGYSNIGVGIKALYNNTTSSNLVAVGDSALYSNTSGFGNTAVGSKALYANINGYSNTANGDQALYSNIDGRQNTANGFQALYSNTTGSHNTANGSHTLSLNTTGLANTANGSKALYSNTTGSSNIANGAQALLSNTTGNRNTANGANALFSNTTGSQNTALGFYADVLSGALTNATVIGYNAFVNASNKVRIGNTDVTVIEGQVAYSFPSDARFKYNIQSNVPGLDFIKKLRPVTYYFDEEKLANYNKTGLISSSTTAQNSIIRSSTFAQNASYKGEKQLHTGFLAQDVERIAKELGYSFDGIHAPANDKDHYSLAYSQFIMPLVKAVQELTMKVEKLEKENELLNKQVDPNLSGEIPTIVGKQQKQIDEKQLQLNKKQSQLDGKQQQIDELKARLENLEKLLVKQ